MNGFRKIFNAPGVDLMPALPENHMLEKRFGSRLQQVCDERQGTRVFQGSSCFARWLYRVETFASAEEFLKYDRSEAAGCVVLELQLAGPSGLELQEALARSEEPLPVIFLTAHGDISSAVRAMKQGAVDFLTKPVLGRELLEAVQRALAWGSTERQTRLQKREWHARYERLTLREREVFALVIGGLLNKQICDVLGITERTIKAHRAQVMYKMEVQSPVELGRAADGSASSFRPHPCSIWRHGRAHQAEAS